MHFKLIASEPFDESKLTLNHKNILMRNIAANTQHHIVELFAENLVVNDNSGNDVVQLTKSGMFTDTYIVQFKENIDYDTIIKRLQRRPTLNERKVALLQAYNTNSLLVRKCGTDNKPVSTELIEMHFANRKRCGTDTYTSIRERDTFLVLIYESQETVDALVAKKHEIQNQELVVERLFNFQLLDEVKEGGGEVDVTCLAKETAKEIRDEKKEAEIVQTQGVEPLAPIEQEPLFILVTSAAQDCLKVLFLMEDMYFPRLRDDLMKLGARVTKRITPDGIYELKIESLFEKVDASQWKSDVGQLVQRFMELFDSKRLKIANSNIFQMAQEKCVVLNTEKKDLYELVGTKEALGEINFLLQKLEQQMESKRVYDEEIVDDEQTGLKLFQIRILFVNKYVLQMREQHPEMLLSIDAKNRSVHFRGTRLQISDAKSVLKAVLDSVLVSTMPADDALVKLMLFKENDIVKWIKEKVKFIFNPKCTGRTKGRTKMSCFCE